MGLPSISMHRKLAGLVMEALACLLLAGGLAHAQDQQMQAGQIIVIYHDQQALQKFGEEIRPGAFSQALNGILGDGGGGSNQDLGGYLTNLLRRVQMVLDMPTPKIKLTIKVFASQQELSNASVALTGHPMSAPGFYWHPTKTIHVHLDELTVGILAHEMGHAVIDHFLIVIPPTKIAEMLCQYVDREITEGRF